MAEVLLVKRLVIRKTCLRLLLALVAAALLCPSLGAGSVAADTTWTQTSQADFTSGTLVQLDAATSPGDVMLVKVGGGDYLYAFRGSNSKTFWRYNVSSDSWSTLANAPQNVGPGGALAYDGNDYIYALCGNGEKYFWRYNISSNTWSSLHSTPYSINAGGALAFTGSYIYATRGGGSKRFYRYSISGDSWSTKASAPSGVSGGGALAYDDGNYIYALKGGSNTTFWRYSISGNSWTTMAGTPSVVSDGGSLAYDGGSYIYALKGLDTVTFWRYSISANSWASMADTPATPCVYGGGALAYDEDGHLYALRGNNQDDFWKYTVSGDAWSTLHDTPANVAWGGALAFVGASSYYASGELTSSAYDTGGASNFGNISWTSSTPASTAIKFQIATNNDSATWDFKGPDGASGTYYTSSGAAIWSGHDSDRYIKYKAFFSTSDVGVTPVLNDVSINYSALVVLPSATTSAATLVEETTATLHGSVTDDGGEACQYQFAYGTVPGGPYPYATGWTGSVTTGNTFYADVTGLAKGTKYYFVAQVQNSYGTGSGGELDFLTKPDEPVNTTFVATVVSATQIDLTWTKGEGAWKTMIRRSTGDYPVDRDDGVLVYFDTGTSCSDTGLTPETLYYYRAWSYVEGSSQWSDFYQDAAAQTSPGSTEPPVTIGGSVFPVNKLQVLLPWLCIAGALMLIIGGVTFGLVRKRITRR